ncbi:MAG: DUF1232 domain-containing protein [Ignavibacteriales bacterium]|nr:DUF1232 domain-containing protein [Ignavibacteriales bacterium]MBK7981969.1 DUF1232 domain-containing protein [Ignavibacteriota bacterium]
MNKEEKYYKKLRSNISIWLDEKANLNHKWREFIMLVPDIFYLMIKLIQDPEVPQNKKLKLVSAVAYFISPIDLMPEIFLGPIGYLDDIAIAAFILNEMINSIDPQIVKKHWAGDVDILIVIKKILINVDNLIGKGIWDKLKGKFN